MSPFVDSGSSVGNSKPLTRRIFSMSGMWSDVNLGIVKDRSSKWARMSDDRSRRARTLDRPHRVNPDAWSNYRGTTHSVAMQCNAIFKIIHVYVQPQA